jgi:PTH1 family peptidyl-tRNA hydrolase
MVVDNIARDCGVLFEYNAGFLIGFGFISEEHVILVKPQTYMNNSGDVLDVLSPDSELTPSKLVVIHDDLDLDPGRLKIKHGGGDGGHRGVASIIVRRMDAQFTRVRIGVGRPIHPMTSADHVLSPMTEKDRLEFKSVTQRAADAVRCLVCDGVNMAMNSFNIRKNESSITQ